MPRSDFKYEPGASEALIDRTLFELGRALPSDYLDFMRRSNGGEGFMNDEYLQLWRVEDVPGWSRAYLQHTEFEDNTDVVLFGGNGGGEAFGFDFRANGAVVEGPMIGMESSALLPCAETFTKFLERPTAFT